MASRTHRGSRKHVLDWTSRPEFATELLRMVLPVECKLTARSKWMPAGHQSAGEARLASVGPEILPNEQVQAELRTWWLAHEHGANTPNWDLAASCEIDGKPGLILVEAKANLPELNPMGKADASNASAASQANDARIAVAISEACAGLRRAGVAASISRDSHYQLSNRIAFAWKLAALGVPTVLVYLGFLGDDGIADVGTPFVSHENWALGFRNYANAIVPPDAFERRIDCGAAPVWFLVRSRPVLEKSQPR